MEFTPEHAYTTVLVFDLPSHVRRPRLLLGDPPAIECFLIGHENSFFHKKILFDLTPATMAIIASHQPTALRPRTAVGDDRADLARP